MPVADGHPSWCARGHRCGLGEHRSQPVTIREDVTYTLVGTERAVWIEFTGALLLEHPDQAGALAAAVRIALDAVRAGDGGRLEKLAAIAGR